MDSKDQNLDLIRTKRIHFNPFSFARKDVFNYVSQVHV